MTTSTTEPRRLRLGFNTRVSFGSGQEREGLRDGIALFDAAEELGFQSGWSYQRHFDNYQSSPLTFLAAAAQHTERIELGTAVVPMRYHEPVVLAEAAATADLLSDGRILLGVSSGGDHFDRIFGAVETDARTEGERRVDYLLLAVDGDVLDVVEDAATGLAAGTELRVTPYAPGLRDRVYYGSGHIASALEAARRRLRLLTGTVLHDVTDETFPVYQARLIAEYRAAYEAAHQVPAPPVAVAASVLPGTTPQLREKYAAYDVERQTKGIAASKPQGALEHTTAPENLPADVLVSPVHRGTPDDVIASLLADPGIAAADELVLFLPPAFGLAENLRLIEDVARYVAPELGWTPGA